MKKNLVRKQKIYKTSTIRLSRLKGTTSVQYCTRQPDLTRTSIAMVTLDTRTLTVPVGIVRMLEVVLTCISFSLVASVGHFGSSYWAWCMFTWVFCCLVTLLILIMEFTTLHARVPISWDDFTTAFAMLSTLMVGNVHGVFCLWVRL